MKKQISISLALLLSFCSMEVSAQSFLKELTKTVKKEVENRVVKEVQEQVNKGLDKITHDQPQTQQPAAQTTSQQQAQTNQSQSQRKSNKSLTVETIAPIAEYGPVEGSINGHEWVDLGLPSGTRWATCNVDATSPEQPGKHYSWGEIAPKSSYTESNAKLYRKDVPDFSNDKVYDVAAAKWGDGWRMPTKKDFDELHHYCSWRYVQKGGRWGAEFTSRKNQKSIFLPATGFKDGTAHREASGCGNYWTSTPYKDNVNNGAHEYHFGGALGEMGIGERYYGYAVRPVTDYDVKIEVPSSGEINGHKWVDLGLPSGLKWATCNLGAETVDQDGDFYSWGEITLYTDKDSPKNDLDGKHVGDISANSRYDAARAVWGSTWRLPTDDEFRELMDNCTFELTSFGRRRGLKITSKTNGNYILLPAAGKFANRVDVYGYGYADSTNELVDYWTSTPVIGEYAYDAYHFYVYIRDNNSSVKSSAIILPTDRFAGLSIRPVSD